MKKAFTLSEALITLAIIGVLAAVVIPVISNVKPDKDKVTYRKALYSMQSAISSAMESDFFSTAANASAYWKDEKFGGEEFCQQLANSLNTKGAVNCTSTSSYEHPNFTTIDGIKYWGLEGGFVDSAGNISDKKVVYVDYNKNAGDIKNRLRAGGDENGMKIMVKYDGKVYTPDDTTYDYENQLIDETYSVSKKYKPKDNKDDKENN